jgi:DNA-binding PadR family transcriptional regulator
MILTNRDKNLFEKLNSYAVMTTRQVAKTVFPDIQLTTILRRLRKLEKQDFIKRNVGLSTYEHSWTLTEKGAKLVSDRPPRWHQSRFLLEHDTKLTALRISLEAAGIAQSWVPEHEIRFKVASKHGVERAKEKLIPDGIMGIEWQNAKESLAIELELHSKHSRRYMRNFHEYKYKQNILGVWYLTSTPMLARMIEKLWLKQIGANQKPFFYWSLVDEVIENPLKALVHSNGKSAPLAKIWLPKIAKSDAHTLAHPMSKQTERKDLELRA